MKFGRQKGPYYTREFSRAIHGVSLVYGDIGSMRVCLWWQTSCMHGRLKTPRFVNLRMCDGLTLFSVLSGKYLPSGSSYLLF